MEARARSNSCSTRNTTSALLDTTNDLYRLRGDLTVAVEVKLKGTTTRAEHADALAIVVREPHLIVQGAGKVTIAIYAPGTWEHGVVKK